MLVRSVPSNSTVGASSSDHSLNSEVYHKGIELFPHRKVSAFSVFRKEQVGSYDVHRDV